jgi:hypothetical protein
MAYRLYPETGEIVCDTPAQVLACWQVFAASPGTIGRNPPRVAVKAAVESVSTLSGVVAALQKRPRQLMEALLQNPAGVLDSQIYTQLDLKKRGHVSAVVTTLHVAFARANYRFDQVIERKKHLNGHGPDRISMLRPEIYGEVKKALGM